MSITFDPRAGVFKLDTPRTSYIMALADQKWLGHIYYGPRLASTGLDWALKALCPPTPDALPREGLTFHDAFPAEFSPAQVGDFRETCLAVETAAGQLDCLPVYESHTILPGKPALGDLPATWGAEGDCTTLTVTLRDRAVGVRVELLYTAFDDVDAITRSVRVTCEGEGPVTLRRCLSACLDLPAQPGMELITLHGSWARERGIQRRTIGCGFQGTVSKRGISSHQEHPFLAVVTPGASQTQGQVWAMNFVYSGSFLAQVERNQFDSLRMVMGLHPETFSWRLEPGESFQAPEAVLVYSAAGLDPMTHSFHDLYRRHLIRSPWLYERRPVLINNWEATYFSFDEEKLLSIAALAARSGIELFVLDDGWFGHRDSDNCSLGDWDLVDRRKLPHGLDGLADRINALGLKFGIWMEPEMVSMDSELYRAHPDWVIRTASRPPQQGREQLVLDLSRPEVEEHIWQKVSGVLRSASISYLKWDMNRPLTDLGSAALPPERQGELQHRYTLALYRLQGRLAREFPGLLLENCSSGGARFDPGMLFFSPQIWTSDDTDASERLSIQEGTALIYPLSSIGAHVSACPNHTVWRTTPFETRGIVASLGTFGYELDITKLTPAEQAQIPGQIARYAHIRELIQRGDYYRLSSAREGQLDAQIVVSPDRGRAVLTVVRDRALPNWRQRPLPLRGLDPEASYQVEGTDQVYPGDALMAIGLPLTLPRGDHAAVQLCLIRV